MPHDLYPPDVAALLSTHAGQKWRPSNGTEGEAFMASWCAECANNEGTEENGGRLGCIISLDTSCYRLDEPEYPAEWCLSATGQPQCTAYRPKENDDATQPVSR